jgi:hypothetical protein
MMNAKDGLTAMQAELARLTRFMDMDNGVPYDQFQNGMRHGHAAVIDFLEESGFTDATARCREQFNLPSEG